MNSWPSLDPEALLTHYRRMILRSIACLLAIAALLTSAVQAQIAQTNPLVITNLAQLRSLSREVAAQKIPVRTKAVITYYDGSNFCFAQDETGASFVDRSAVDTPIASADMVDIEGVTGPGSFNPTVIASRITTISHNQPMPTPRVRSLNELKTAQDDCLWVKTHGVVYRITRQEARVQLQIASEGSSLEVVIPASTNENTLRSELLYADISVQGVLKILTPRSNSVVSVGVAVPNFSFVQVINPPRVEDRLTTLRFRWLQEDTRTNVSPTRIGIIGKVATRPLRSVVVITNRFGTALEAIAAGPDLASLRVGDWVRVSGFPVLRTNQVRLEDSRVQAVGLIRAAAIGTSTNSQAPLRPEDFESVRENILELRGLSPAVAARGLPVWVKAVVTLADTNLGFLIIQQADQGIRVSPASWPSVPLTPGDDVEVRGFSRQGPITPMIDLGQIQVLGRSPVPTVPSVSMELIQYGQYDSALIKASGFVRSLTPDSGNRLKVEVVDRKASITALVLNATNSADLLSLAGKRVEARGVCVADTNTVRHPGGSMLLVSSPQDLVVLAQSANDLNALPMSTVSAVQELSQAGSNQTARIQATVLGEWLEGPTKRLFVSDKTANIMVDTGRKTGFKPGTQVDLMGMSDLDGAWPVIRARSWRVLGDAALPSPTHLEAISDWTANQPGLVELSATVVVARRNTATGGLQLVLSHGRDLFEAYVQAELELSSDRIPKAGSEISVTGIVTGSNSSASFLNGGVLLVRSPEDIVIVSSPAWWTPRRIAMAAGVIAVCFLAGVAWVLSLHRRVREQTQVIRRDLEAEAALEKRYQLVWETSADGMRMTDEDGIVSQVNDAYCRMVRKSREELVGQPFTVVFRGEFQEAVLKGYRERFRTSAMVARTAYETVMWDGRKAAFELANSLFEQPGKPALLLSVIREITERKRLEEELRTAQKMEVVGRLAGGVAHDFNNILTVIRGYTGLCKDDDRLPADVHEMLAEIDVSASRAATLVRQLLTFSRRQPLNIRSVNLAKVVENMLQMLTRLLGDDIKVEFHQETPVPLIHADTSMMEQIVMNLTVNARDAMRAGGRLKIDVRGVEFTAETAKGSPDRRVGRFACLTVEDTGCGMDEATLTQVFEPFFTTKDVGKGTGLGLSTVYGIVKQHFGWIEASSQVGKGTQFRVCIPADESPVTETVTEFRLRVR